MVLPPELQNSAAGPADRPSQEKRRPMPNETHKPKDASATIPDRSMAQRRAISDTMPEQAGVYVPPRPLATPADHRTIEIQPVRLAQEIDPRRAMTELKLTAPPLRPNRLPWFVAAGLIALVGAVLYAARDAQSPGAAPSAVAPPSAAPLSTHVAAPALPPMSPPVSMPVTEEPNATAPVTNAPAPVSTVASEPPLVPVTPDDLDREARSASTAPKAVESSPKKVREPWLE